MAKSENKTPKTSSPAGACKREQKGGNYKYTPELADKVIDALERHWGVKTMAARECGIDRKTINRWAEQYPEFKKRLEEVIETTDDLGEDKFLELVKKGDRKAVIHFAKTRLKKRGYGINMDISGTVNTLPTHNGKPYYCSDEDEEG